MTLLNVSGRGRQAAKARSESKKKAAAEGKSKLVSCSFRKQIKLISTGFHKAIE